MVRFIPVEAVDELGDPTGERGELDVIECHGAATDAPPVDRTDVETSAVVAEDVESNNMALRPDRCGDIGIARTGVYQRHESVGEVARAVVG